MAGGWGLGGHGDGEIGATVGFDRFHPNISNPCRDDERRIDAARFPAHTHRSMPNDTTFESFEKELNRLVESFGNRIAELKSSDYNEAKLRDDFLNPFFRALGWDMENRAGLIQKEREVEIESATQIGGGRKRADYLFRTDKRDRFVCEAKKPAEQLHARYAFQAKRYAWNKGVPVAVLTDFEELKIFIVGGKPYIDEPQVGEWKNWHYRQYPLIARELWDLLARDKIASGSIDRALEALPKKATGTGKARQQWLIKPDRTRALDSDFLEFLDETRRDLASDIYKNNGHDELLDGNKLTEAVQRIIDRILFLRICEDRDIDTGTTLQSIVETWRKRTGDDDTGRRAHQQPFELREEPPADYGGDGIRAPKDSLWRAVVRHFRALDRRPPTHVPFFNGNLFKSHFTETLVIGDEWLAGFIGELSDDESPYLFNVIDVEILGSVYERFLGKVVRPQGRGITIEEKPEVRKAGGVYYTPRYIVDYIVEQTAGKLLDEIAGCSGAVSAPDSGGEERRSQTAATTLKDFEKKTAALRLLDPACGSGSFLIRAFERVCEHWQKRLTADLREVLECASPLALSDTPDVQKRQRAAAVQDAAATAERKSARAAWERKHRPLCWVDSETSDVHLTVALKRQILTQNIYGVDLDAAAVEVTQLSLYLKMLEHENRTTLQRQRELLSDEAEIALLPPLQDNIKCGNSLIDSDFSMMSEDLVRVHAFDWPVQFQSIMKAGGFDAVIGNPPYIPIETMEDEERTYYQEAYPQLERKYDTGVIFILRAMRLVKSTGFVGYISSITWETGENFAKLREEMFTKHGVSEVINLPFNTFDDAYVDTGVYILCGKPSPEYRIFRYSKKAKIDSLKDAAPITVPTSLVTAPDFRLVLDPNAQRILLRASTNAKFKLLGEFTKSTQGLAADRFQRGASTKSSEWYPFGEQAQAYRYDFVVEERSFAYMRDNPSLKQFYEAEPKILIRRIINRQDRLDAAFCDEQMVFKKDINPFVLTVTKPSPKFVLGIINSMLLSYLYVNTSAIATKDDFRQTTLAELRRLPIPFPDFTNKADKARHDKLVVLVDKLLGLMPKLRTATADSEKAVLQNAVTATDQQIDALVYELYGLTEDEIKLVEGTAK